MVPPASRMASASDTQPGALPCQILGGFRDPSSVSSIAFPVLKGAGCLPDNLGSHTGPSCPSLGSELLPEWGHGALIPAAGEKQGLPTGLGWPCWMTPLGGHGGHLGKPSPRPHNLPSAGVTLAQDGVPQRPQGGRSTLCPRASGASASELTRGGTRKREPWVGNTEPWPSELPEAASASHEVTACTHSCGDAQWTQRADPCVFLVLPVYAG